MKRLILMMLLALSFKSVALGSGIKESLPYWYCTVLKDSIDETIPKGKIKISGNIFYASNEPVYGQFVKGDANHRVKITFGNTNQTMISSDGSFSLVMDTSLAYLTFELLEKGDGDGKHEVIYFENYQLRSQHALELKVEMPYHSDAHPITVDKPVIYLYSDSTLDVSITLKTDLKLSFVYPAFQEATTWYLKCDRAGIQIGENKYPYLFWEGQTNVLQFDRKEGLLHGSLVKKEEVVAFLEKSLDLLGLNSTEKTDFITYWAPKMLQSERLFVQFLVDDDCNSLAELNVNPKPDSQRRIYMLYREIPTDVQVEFTPQKLIPLRRKGFTLIEWGGSEIKDAEL